MGTVPLAISLVKKKKKKSIILVKKTLPKLEFKNSFSGKMRRHALTKKKYCSKQKAYSSTNVIIFCI